MNIQTFDFIVVGAGSAGCVLANRLSANGRYSVCLLETGGSDSTPRVQVPAGTLTLYKSRRLNYCYESVPQARMNGRTIFTPRGKMLGGSSSMNSMIYIRGARSDYDHWAALGCAGWDYASILPFFKRSERNLLDHDARYHGADGELLVDRPRDPNPLSAMFVAAAGEIGLSHNRDFNGATLDGVGLYDVTQRNGQRLSSYRAFVHPIRERANLHVETGCRVVELSVDQKRVQGVIVEQAGARRTLRAQREVILSAGAFGSPQVLLSSGIGDASELLRLGISVRHHLPGVGRNLQDHLDGLVTMRSSNAGTLGFSVRSLSRVLPSPLTYLARRKGWLTTNYVEAGGFARTRYADGVPDVQFHFVPGYRSHRGRLFEYGHGLAIHTCVLRPRSTGRVTLVDDGTREHLSIDNNFLDDEHDARVLIEGLKIARRILAARAFDSVRGKEMLPGTSVQSDDALFDYIRAHGATVFHPSGTCKMGVDDTSVVDPALKVIGMHGLRVADASIMPTLVSGNTNAPSIMIGEKAAAMILGDAAATG